jgi:hypothetical protein
METYPIASSLVMVIIVVAILELIAKGFALWKAAKTNQNAWFIVLLITNTAGILPLIYLKFFNKPIQ